MAAGCHAGKRSCWTFFCPRGGICSEVSKGVLKLKKNIRLSLQKKGSQKLPIPSFQADAPPPNQDECGPHTSVLPVSSLFTCDGTPLNARDSTCVFHVLCLLVGAGPSVCHSEAIFTLPCRTAQGACLPCLYHPGSLTL